jgi:uncharacterized protein YdhG (YjbR/CyaY superfamily)
MPAPADVDEYIDAASPTAQPLLRELRRLILTAVPDATERVSYGMPTYDYLGQRLLHFSAAKNHVGVYALVHADGVVPPQLARHLDHRSTLHFRFDEKLPGAALTAALREKARKLRS